VNDRQPTTAIIAAAGIGSRMHADRAKQMLELGGSPLLMHTLERFEECKAIDRVILVLQPDLTAEVLALLSRRGLKKISRVVAGGPTRHESVFHGLQVLRGNDTDNDDGVVVIHDAARPFVRPSEIEAVVERAKSTGAAIMALPATDTMKQVKSGRVQKTLERRRIYHAQTPQAFRLSLIRSAYEQAQAEGFIATDDSQLVERLGSRVAIVEGSPLNIKITRPLDLGLAEVILARYF
jgi:2-C-methyl-D-erythritol 4-phosphate cytidylyltransferase